MGCTNTFVQAVYSIIHLCIHLQSYNIESTKFFEGISGYRLLVYA